MQHQAGVAFVKILIEVIDMVAVEAAGKPLAPVHHLTIIEQELNE